MIYKGDVTKEPNAYSKRENQEHIHVQREASKKPLKGMGKTKSGAFGKVRAPTINAGHRSALPRVEIGIGRKRLGRGYDQIALTRERDREIERCLWVVLLTGYKDGRWDMRGNCG